MVLVILEIKKMAWLKKQHYEASVFLYFKKNETIMSPKHEKSNNELIKKYSKLLTDLASDD